MTVRRVRSILCSLTTALVAAALLTACPDGVPLPLAGWAEFQDPLFVQVPGGRVNTGGGNFHTRRTDLSIDTRVGSYALAAVYNSASGGWRWAHEMTYQGTAFVDDTGASFNLSSVPNGTAIPGTHWVRLDADSIKTKGGLVHDFSASGKLAAIHWLGFDYPQLRFTTQVVGGGTERVTAIDQCTAATTCSNVFTLAYTASAQLQTVTDRANRVASFTWDGSGRLATAKDGLDNAKGWLGFRYEYSGTNLTAITSSENERTEYTYDASARLLTAKKIGDGNPTWSFTYFAAQTSGLYLTRLTNPLSEITNFSFDGYRRLFSLQLASVGETTSFQWSGNRVTQITRPDGVQTQFTITDDDVTQVSEASGNVTTLTYAPNAIDPPSPNARPIDTVSDSISLLLDRSYDPQGRLTASSNAAGDTTSYAWQTGSPTARASVTSPLGVVTSYGAQGEHGHPANATTGPHTKPFTYDAVGNMLEGQSTASELSPGMGGVVSRTFDADRNIATVVLKSMVPTVHDETMTLETRSDGRLAAIRPPYGGDTEFDYSATGRVLARREKAGGAWVTTSFGWDALDRITSTELANAMRSELGYDGAGRMNAITSKRSGVVEETLARSFSANRLTSSVDSAYAGPETYAYDSAGRVSTITYPGGERRELVYDLRSRVTTERFIDASDVTIVELVYSYDLANRITEVRRGPLNLLVLKYTYTNGFVTQTDYGNGFRRTATPDLDFGLPDSTLTTNAQSQTVESTDNDFNAFLTWKWANVGGSQLPEEMYATSNEWRATLDSTTGTYWDALSNARKTTTREFLYNPEANRLSQIRDLAAPQTIRHTYQYDAAGFVTNRDGVALGYDATGAIASIGSVAAFDHDLDGRPVSRTLDGVTKHFRFGGAIAYTPSGNLIEMDLGEVVIKLDGTGNRFRHMDFRGNVMFVSKANTIEGTATYRSFGRWSATGNLGERGFAQGFEIPSLGLVVLGPRVLDSDAGRFLSQDPVFNAVNLYTYAQGNPVYLWDPTGWDSSPYANASRAGTAWGFAVGRVVAAESQFLGARARVAGAVAGAAAGLMGRAWFVSMQYVAWESAMGDAPAPDPVRDILLGPGLSAAVDAVGALGSGIQGARGDPPQEAGTPSFPEGFDGLLMDGVPVVSVDAIGQINIAITIANSVYP
jgi:RHS repeat-associated protein